MHCYQKEIHSIILEIVVIRDFMSHMYVIVSIRVTVIVFMAQNKKEPPLCKFDT